MSVTHPLHRLPEVISGINPSKLFVLSDEKVLHYCLPVIKAFLPDFVTITLPEGEENKTLNSCVTAWELLTAANADRKACIINLGGGVVGDLGGFVAGCYKRGVRYVQVPTTLLAMLDASVGAKTGIDFMGYKNQLGLFNEPEAIIIHTPFLNTLPQRQLLSGFAEVIKHYAIADADAFYKLVETGEWNAITDWDEIVFRNIAIKRAIVQLDPFEQKERKALNFGHTLGHALESYYLFSSSPLLHGEAIAAGMVIESIISSKLNRLTIKELDDLVGLVKRYFILKQINEKAQESIIGLMYQDKKNEGGLIMMTLLNSIGNYSVNNSVNTKVIKEAFQYYNQLSS